MKTARGHPDGGCEQDRSLVGVGVVVVAGLSLLVLAIRKEWGRKRSLPEACCLSQSLLCFSSIYAMIQPTTSSAQRPGPGDHFVRDDQETSK